jgi:hypothetical protein
MAGPALSVRLMDAQSSLATTLEALGAMTRGPLRIDPESVLGPVAAALPHLTNPDQPASGATAVRPRAQPSTADHEPSGAQPQRNEARQQW